MYVCLVYMFVYMSDVHSVHGVWFTCVQFTRVYGERCTVSVYGVRYTAHGSYFGRAESLF